MSRWLNALIKCVIFFVVVHFILLIFGYFFGATVGVFGINVLWSHLSTLYGWIISVIVSVVVYLIIYNYFTPKSTE